MKWIKWLTISLIIIGATHILADNKTTCANCCGENYGTQTTTDSIRKALKYQMENYPVSQYRDVYKNFMQDFFGPGHLLNDTAASGKYLRHEVSTTTKFEGPEYEPTGYKGNFYRVNLSLIKDGTIPYNIYFDTFVNSVQNITPPLPDYWKNIWQTIDNEINAMGFHFENEASDRAAILDQLNKDDFVVHHSDAYNENVNFHYRIISKDNFDKIIKPLIDKKK